jgi:HMG (high mobility group) box
MPPRKRRRKKKSHPDKPKKGMSAFMLFCKDNRPKVRQEFDGQLTFGQIGKKLGEMWRATETSMKDEYKKRSDEDKLRAQKLLARWYTTHPETSSESEDDTRSRRRKKDPNAPKGAISAYFFFCRKYRPIEKSKNPEITFTELGKNLGAMWKQLTPEEREPFVQQAAADKERYDREKEEYDRTHPKPPPKPVQRRKTAKRRKQESSSEESSSEESSSEESSSEESSSESESE